MVTTYPEMNKKIVGILELDKDNPISLYAAQRIRELEKELEELK